MDDKFDNLIKLIKKAQGNRSLNQFALHCNISSAHLSRVYNGKFVNPPSPDFLKSIATKAYNEVTYEDLMQAAGYLDEDYKIINNEFPENIIPLNIDGDFIELYEEYKKSDLSKEEFKEIMKFVERMKKKT